MARLYVAAFVILAVTLGASLSEEAGRPQQARLVATTVADKASGDVPANARPGVKYVGSEACIECHKDQHASYLKTTHSVATEKTEVETEPDGTTFQHEHTGHTYQVDKVGAKLIHREIVRDATGAERNRTEVPITHSIGSGTHGKSYLYRDGEFWGQSPLSWFKETKDWGMSPGYQSPMHISFRRPVGTGCVFCHVGSIDHKKGNPYCFEIIEEKIGCERCHGPGELHVKRYRENPQAKGPDDTIVNPVNLSRELSEAVCQQCHLQAAAKSPVSGKDEWEFRPGLPLTDFRIDYQYRLGDDTMKIVGHVEQLHQSKCYQQAESLTCVTCHNPHDPIAEEQQVDFYRSVCLDCHQDQSCGKPRQERIDLAGNDCSQCHMPKQDTEVVHSAFHHHRIGIHDEEDVAAREVIAGLSPVLKVDSLTENERRRCAALAKVQAFREQPGNPSFRNYPVEAIGELVKLKEAGVDDPELNAVLGGLAQEQGQSAIGNLLARQVRKQQRAPTRNRIVATRQLATQAFQQRQFDDAARLFGEVVGMQREATDYYYLGVSENNAGNFIGAIDALNRSIQIDPSQDAAHLALQAIYQARRDTEKSRYHAAQAIENQRHRQQMIQKQQSLFESAQGK